MFSFPPFSLLFFFLGPRNSKKATIKRAEQQQQQEEGEIQVMAAGSAKALPQQLDLTIISTAFFGIQFPPGSQGKIANAPRALSSFRILVLLIYFCLSMFLPLNETLRTGFFLNHFRQRGGVQLNALITRSVIHSFMGNGKKLTFLAVVVVPTESPTISTGWTTILTFWTFTGPFITL